MEKKLLITVQTYNIIHAFICQGFEGQLYASVHAHNMNLYGRGFIYLWYRVVMSPNRCLSAHEPQSGHNICQENSNMGC